jgi:putative transposase
VARCTVERLMRGCGLRGIPREKTRKTTIGDGAETPRPADKVNRQCVDTAPNQLWVADMKCRRRHFKSYADLRTMPTVRAIVFAGEAFGGDWSA